MRNLFPLLSLLSLLIAVPVSRADEAGDKAELGRIEKTCMAALVKGDYQALGDIFAEDWVLVDGSGQVSSRDQIFKALESGELKFSSYDLGELDIRVVGDTAAVIGHGHPRGQFKGEPFEENEVFTDTFARVGGKWRCIVSHSVDIPDQSK